MKMRKLVLVLAALVSILILSTVTCAAADEITEINSVEDWNAFAESVSGGNTYSGKTVTLKSDLSGVESMVGTSGTAFAGTFEGNGHTIDVSIETAEQYAAPFRYIWGASIRNLHVEGTIKTSAKFAGGIVSQSVRHSTIQNCRSSVTIESSVEGDGTHGGIAAVNGRDNIDTILTIRGCVFDGKFTGEKTTNCGGFVGWSVGTWTYSVVIEHCIFAPESMSFGEDGSQTFARARGGYVIENSYYTEKLGGLQGRPASAKYSIVLGENIELDGTTEYNVSGINAHGNKVLQYDGKTYANPDADVTLKYTGEVRSGEGVVFSVKGKELPVDETKFKVPKTEDKDPETDGPVDIEARVVEAFDIKLADNVTGGSVEISPKRAYEGQTINLKLKPAKGYAIDEEMVFEYEDSEGQVDQLKPWAEEPYDEISFTMPPSDVTIYANFTEVPLVTEIDSIEKWNTFVESLNKGGNYYEKTVNLNADIGDSTAPVTKMAGTEDHPFEGVFNGKGHTLYVKLSDEDNKDYIAPFRHIMAAKIQDLKVKGEINTSGMYAGGIVGHSLSDYYNSNNSWIVNCMSSVTINSTKEGDGTHGGLVGRNGVYGKNHILEVQGSVFNGSLLSEGGKTTHSGGLVGYTYLGTRFNDSLFAPLEVTYGTKGSATLARTDGNYMPYTGNTYYTKAFGATDYQGKKAHMISLKTPGIVSFASASSVYIVSGLSFLQQPAFKYNNDYYSSAGSSLDMMYNGQIQNGKTVIFTIEGENTKEDIKAVGGKATFKMPDEDVKISTKQVDLYNVEIGDVTNGTLSVDIEQAIEGETVTVTPTADRGCTSKDAPLWVKSDTGEESIDAQEDGTYKFTMPASDVTLSMMFYKVPTVTDIDNEEDWSAFVNFVSLGADYSGETVRLNSDITVTEMVGTEEHPFNGTFIGGGHTITCNLDGGSAQGAAPFSYIENAVIRDVRTEGTVKGANHASGLVGFAWAGENLIQDCFVAPNITTTGSHAGGIVGHSKTSDITIEGCILAGNIGGYSQYAAGLVGWTDGSKITISNSISSATHDGTGKYHPIALKNPGSSIIDSFDNTYYDGADPEVGEGTNTFVTKAVKANLVELEENIEIKGDVRDYPVSGITATGSSISMTSILGTSIFSGEGETLEFNYLLKTEENEIPQYTVNEEELKPGITAYTMKNEPIRVSVKTVEAYKIELGEVTGGTITPDAGYAKPGDRITLDLQPDKGWMIDDMILTVKYTDGGEEKTAEVNQDVSGAYGFTMPKADVTITGAFEEAASVKEIASEEDWNKLATTLKNGADYSGVTVKLVSDIKVSTMVGTADHPFTGAFDGNGHTITVDLTSSEEYIAPFRFTKDSAINNLTVTGTINASAKFAGGFVGWAQGVISIKNSRSDVKIVSSVNGDGTHGGFIARQGDDVNNGELSIEGSIVTGSMVMSKDADYATTNCGGFVGYGYANTAFFDDCAYAPSGNDGNIKSGCATFIRQHSSKRMSTAGLFACTESFGSRQNAHLAYKVNAAKNVKVETGESQYSVTGITVKNFEKNGQLYFVNGSDVEVSYTGTLKEGEMALFTVNGEAVSGSTFKMPSKDTSVTADVYKACTVSFDANGGTGEMAPEKAPENKGYKLPSCGFKSSDEDLVFGGWQIGDDAADIMKAGETVVLTGDTTLKAVWKKYRSEISIIGKNNEKTTVTAIDLSLVEPEDESTIELDGYTGDQWYYVDKDFTTDKTLDLYGKVNIILKDGVTITAPKIWTDEETGIYGQENGTGKLVVNEIETSEDRLSFYGGDVTAGVIYAEGSAILIEDNAKLSIEQNDEGVAIFCRALYVSGGDVDFKVSAVPDRDWTIEGFCIYAEETCEITEGTVDLSTTIPEECVSKDYLANARIGAIKAKEIRILGGNVTATIDQFKGTAEDVNCYGLMADEKITLGWRKAEDSITATSYSAGSGTIAVADGQTLVDGNNVYTGELTKDQITLVAGKTLTPPGVIKELKTDIKLPSCGTEGAAPSIYFENPEGVSLSGTSIWTETAAGESAFIGKFAGGKDYYAVFTIEIDDQHLIGGKNFVTVNGEKPENITIDGNKVLIVAKVKAQHEWDEGKVIKEPTCAEEGAKLFGCSGCDNTKTESIEKTAHEIVKAEATEADCQHAGMKEHFECKNCRTMFADEEGKTEIQAKDIEIPVNGDRHTTIARRTENDVKSTCTAIGGYDVVIYCKDCNAVIAKEHIVRPKLGHKWSEWTVTKEATETMPGEEQRICANDPTHVETRVIPVKDHEHKLTKVDAKAATCEQDGNAEYYVCDQGEHPCGRFFKDEAGTQELTKDEITRYALGHRWGDEVKEKEVAATCTTPATYEGVVYCARCSKELSREKKTSGSALGHDYKEVEGSAVAATCEKDGKTADQKCSRCDSTIEGSVIKALGHRWGEWKVTKEATETAEGEEQRTCENDPSHVEKRKIPVIGHEHKLVKVDAKNATCTEDGNIEYYICSGGDNPCGRLFADDKGTKPISKEETVTYATGHEYKEVEGSAKDATCTVDGKTAEQKCTRCGDVIEGTVIKATGHKWDEGKEVKKATCSEEGEILYTCEVCGETRTEKTVMTEHDIVLVEQADADCQNEGLKEHYECSACGKMFTDAVGSAEISKEDLIIPINGDRHTKTARKTENDVPATCTKIGGYDFVVYCEDCGAVIAKEHIVRPRLGHKWGEWKVTKEPTETEPGEEQRVCENDPEHVETRMIPVIGHVHELTKVDAVKATCTEDGNIEYYVCDKGDHPCGRFFADEKGEKELTQDEITEYALGHKWGEPVKENEVAATCTAPYTYEAVIYCTSCGEEMARDKKTEGSALGHKWGAPTYAWASDNSEVTVERVCQNDPSHKESETAKTTSEITKEATYEAEGEKRYTAAFQNPAFTTQIKTEVIPKLEPEDRSKQMGEDGTPFGKGASLEAAEAALAKLKSDSDPAGTKYAPLMLKSTKQTKKSIKLSWKTAKGTTKYIVYANKCGKTKKLTKLAELASSKRAYTVKKAAGKKLKKATYYKFIMIAVDADNNVVTTSRIDHIATAGSRKAGNPKKVVVKAKVSKTGKKLKKYKATSAIAVKAGKTTVLKSTFTKAKKTKVKKHVAIRYESSNKAIVTITKKGKVKGIKKGTVRIYAYAQNGVVKAVKLKVK